MIDKRPRFRAECFVITKVETCARARYLSSLSRARARRSRPSSPPCSSRSPRHVHRSRRRDSSRSRRPPSRRAPSSSSEEHVSNTMRAALFVKDRAHDDDPPPRVRPGVHDGQHRRSPRYAGREFVAPATALVGPRPSDANIQRSAAPGRLEEYAGDGDGANDGPARSQRVRIGVTDEQI